MQDIFAPPTQKLTLLLFLVGSFLTRAGYCTHFVCTQHIARLQHRSRVTTLNYSPRYSNCAQTIVSKHVRSNDGVQNFRRPTISLKRVRPKHTRPKNSAPKRRDVPTTSAPKKLGAQTISPILRRPNDDALNIRAQKTWRPNNSAQTGAPK